MHEKNPASKNVCEHMSFICFRWVDSEAQGLCMTSSPEYIRITSASVHCVFRRVGLQMWYSNAGRFLRLKTAIYH